MANANNGIVVNYTSQQATFKVGGSTTAELADGAIALVDDIGQGTSFEVEFSGPQGAGSADLRVGDGANSFSVFVFTNNGYCNVYPSPNAQNIQLG